MTALSLEQRIRYEYPAPVANLRQRLVVVPIARHGRQRRLSWSIAVDGPARSRVGERVDRFGNHVLSVSAGRVPGWVEFTVCSEVEVDSRGAALRVSPDRRYLTPTRLTAPDAAVTALTAEVGPEPAAICARVHAAF